jgi:phytoene dehydrogenase-like protein
MSAEFDCIFIGSGHNALTCASYMAKSGLKTLVIERRSYVGGASITIEKIPYFRYNIHSFSYQAVPIRPPFKDLGLGRYCELLLPQVQIALAKQDGRNLCIHVDPRKTAKAVGKFSAKDGALFPKMYETYRAMINKLLIPLYYTDPFTRTKEEEDAFIESVPNGKYFLETRTKTVIEHAEDTWESEEMRLVESIGPLLVGLPSNAPGSAISLTSLPLLEMTYVVKGGSGNFAQSLRRVFVESGGEILENAHVDRIIVKNGRAIGVLLSSGKQVFAKRFVVSGVDVKQSFERFVELDTLPDEWKAGIRDFKWAKSTDLGVHMALREAPKYNDELADWDPDINSALRIYVGYNSMDDLKEELREIESGSINKDPSKQKFEILHPTRVDPSQAPTGRHTAFFWDFVKCRGNENIGEWDDLGPEMAKLDQEQWRHFAPNMTADNILDTFVYTPLDIQRTLINMAYGDFQMRSADSPPRALPGAKTPIQGYYYCGSGLFPGGGITMAPGYVAANVIAKNEGITPWWQPVKWGNEYPFL